MRNTPAFIYSTLAGVALCLLGGCAARHPDYAGFSTASTVRLITRLDVQGYDDSVSVRTVKGTAAVRTSAEAPPIPIEEIAAELLQRAGLRVVPAGADTSDLVFRTEAQGRALTKSYAPTTSKTGAFFGDQHVYVGDRVFTVPSGFFLRGTVFLEIPGGAARQTSFVGQVRPPADVDITIIYSSLSSAPLYLEYPRPSGGELCNRPNSFSQRTLELLGQVYGIPFLFAVIRSGVFPLDDFAATAMGDVAVRRGDEETLIAALREDGLWRIRRLAVGALGRLGGEAAVGAVVQSLHDPDWRVRERAAEILSSVGSRGAARALIGALRDEEWRVRQAAISGVIGMRRDAAVTSLIDALQDREWRIRLMAARALGEMGDRRAVPALEAALRDPEFGVRYHALVALEQLDDPRAIGPVIASLSDSDAQFRLRASAALARLTGRDFGSDPEAWHGWWEEQRREP